MTRHVRSALAVGMVALAVFNAAGCRRVRSARGHAAIPDTTSSPSDSASAIYSAAALPIPELGYNAREGGALYRRYCLNCHGDEGKGDGFNAYNLDPRPQSLADSTFQARHADNDLATAIRSGGAAVGLSNGMPPWGRVFNERQIQNLVTYVRMLAVPDQDRPSPGDLHDRGPG